MAAFDRILSGIPEMDKALDNIRLGDNVVWRVSDLSEFRLFMEPYVRQAVKDKRKIIYFRFAAHEPLITDVPEVETINIPLSHRFENFTVEIHNAIENAGRDAFYVFDCLSELQTAWATDLMMGNFFRVTCPFLFILDTVAFFPLIRGKHSVNSVNKIIDTTQLFLDVYTGEKDIFVRPEKVWNRDSETMFLPHTYEPSTGRFRPVTDGVKSSRFYHTLGKLRRGTDDRYIDSWDRFFNTAKQKYAAGGDITSECESMCRVMMTRDKKMRQMVKKHFYPEDYFEVRSHMIGTGMIGGKACGMLLSRAIIRNEPLSLTILSTSALTCITPISSTTASGICGYARGLTRDILRSPTNSEICCSTEAFPTTCASSSAILSNTTDRIRTSFAQAAFLRTASATPSRENTNPYSARTEAALRTGWQNLRTR